MFLRRLHLTVVLALAAVLSLRLSAADPVAPERIEQLIGQLGSAKFPEREAASKELDAIGEPALAALRKAVKSGDAETRRRAEELIGRIERRQELDRLLTPTKVQVVCKDVPLSEAVAELVRKSGQPVSLDFRGQAAERKVTVNTGETTFWEALDQFCRQARVREAHAIRLPAVGDKNAPRLSPAGKQRADIVLQDDAPETLPTCFAGAARVRALSPNTVVNGHTRRAGEILFALGFAIEAKTPLEKIVEVRISQAVDENNQSLAPIKDDAAGETVNQPTFIGNVNGRPAGFLSVGDVQAAVRLKAGEQPSKRLKELAGVLTVQVRTPPMPLLTVADILTARGKSVDAKDGRRMTVEEVERKENGELHITVKMSSPGAGAARQGAVIVVPGGEEPGLVLVDEKGADFPSGELRVRTVTVDGNNGNIVTQKLGIVFTPKDGQGAAAQLQYRARRLETVEVPFSLKDVPLP